MEIVRAGTEVVAEQVAYAPISSNRIHVTFTQPGSLGLKLHQNSESEIIEIASITSAAIVAHGCEQLRPGLVLQDILVGLDAEKVGQR